MARVAIVTGGTTGIGAATCRLMKTSGYTVAVNFFGGESEAKEFSRKLGIPIFGWNVADFDACQEGVATVTRQIGPIDVLVNNAGVTQDNMLHKMTLEQWRTSSPSTSEAASTCAEPSLTGRAGRQRDARAPGSQPKLRKALVAPTRAARTPGSMAECPASAMMRRLEPGQARARVSAVMIGQTTS
jgi:NAD(P)-dependent dehydrogenase (short-subunit alcohol dehydrogenase family)